MLKVVTLGGRCSVHLFVFLIAQLILKGDGNVDGTCGAPNYYKCDEGDCCNKLCNCGGQRNPIPDLYCGQGNCVSQCPSGITPVSNVSCGPSGTPSNPPSSLPSNPPSSPPSTSKSKGGLSVGAEVGIGIGVGVAGLILSLVAVSYYCRKLHRAKHDTARPLQPIPDSDTERQNAPMIAHQKGDSIRASVQTVDIFSYDDVKKITNNFVEKIGGGAFGPVYKGKLADEKQVAVKVNSQESQQGRDEFVSEVSVLSRIHHRNLVSLLGLCAEGGERILVYELVDGDALWNHLFGKGRKKTPNLDWPTRLRIAIDAARGPGLYPDRVGISPQRLQSKIIHRDLKSNNIMLDRSLQAKLIDFGLSEIYKDSTREGMSAESEQRSEPSEVKGIRGYRDPEYERTGRPTFKSDVYAFGVVLMELISGNSPMHIIFGEHDRVYGTTVGVFRKLISKNRLEEVVDEKLGGNYDKESMHKVANLAMRCVNYESEGRPTMREVVKELVEIEKSGQNQAVGSSLNAHNRF